MNNAKSVASKWLKEFPEAKVYPAYIRPKAKQKFTTAKSPSSGYPLEHSAWDTSDMAMSWCGDDFAVLDVDDVDKASKFNFTIERLKEEGAWIVKTPSGGFHAIFKGSKNYKRKLSSNAGFDFLAKGHGFILPGNYRKAYGSKKAGEYELIYKGDELVSVPPWVAANVLNIKVTEAGRHDTILNQIRENFFNNLTKEQNYKQIITELIPTFNDDRDWVDEVKRALEGWYLRGNKDKPQLPDGEYKLGRNNSKGIEILRGDTFIGWTGWFISRRNWEYATGYDEYVEFYRNSTSYDLPPLIVVSPDERDDYLEKLPPPVVVPPDISLGGIGETTLFFGKTNQGKSWVGLWCAMMSELPTLYIATEQVDDIVLRAKMMGADNIHIVSQPTYTDIPKLSKLVNDKNIELVVLDVLSPMMMDENTTSEFHRVMEMLKPLTSERRFVIIHHEGKNPEAGARGTSRISDMVNRSYKISIHHENGISNIKMMPDKQKGLVGGEGGRLQVERQEDSVEIIPMDMNEMRVTVNHDTKWFMKLEEAWRIRENNEPLSHTKLWKLLKDVTDMTEKVAKRVIDRWVVEGKLEASGKVRGGGVGYKISEIKVKKVMRK